MHRCIRREKRENRDITLLLGLLLVFSFFVGFVFTRGAVHSMSMNAMLSNIYPFIISQSVEKITDFSRQLSPQSAYQLAKVLVSEWSSSLSRDDLLQLIFSFSSTHKTSDLNMFFNLIAEYSLFEDGAPLAYVAASSGYEDMIPSIERWAREYIKKNKGGTAFFVDDTRKAAEHAVNNNEKSILKRIVHYAASMGSEAYTNLLWRVIDDSRDPQMIPLLIRYGANPRSNRSFYTPLMRAVQKNNIPAVEQLIKLGANVNEILNDEVGSALQIALINNFVQMEQVLRAHGAHE